MQLYPGTNPIPTPTLATGYGLWPTPLVVNGGNLRNAANLMAAVQSDTDRLNALAHRVIVRLNVIDGSTSTFTSTVTTANEWIYNGFANFKNGVTIDTGASFNCERPASFNNNVTLTANAPLLRATGAYIEHPRTTLSDADQTVAAPWGYDEIVLPFGTSDRLIGLAEAPSAVSKDRWLRVSREAAGGTQCEVKSGSHASGTLLVHWHENQIEIAYADLVMRAGTTVWRAVGFCGLKRSTFTSAARTAMGGEQNWAFY